MYSRFITLIIILLAVGVLAGCRASAAAAPDMTPNMAAPNIIEAPDKIVLPGEGALPQAGTENGALGATRTPFQAVAPTQTAALMLTPTVTAAPTSTLTPMALPCSADSGKIQQLEAAFSGGPDLFHFRVYTPPCFSPDGKERYPVLYMIHGQTYSDDQWERLGIGTAADALIDARKISPLLIVMPREENTFADTYLSSFSRDVLEGLIPWIDEHYPTCAERACRALGGLSRGGAWALHLGFTRWDMFGALGLHSTPPFNTDPEHFPSWVQAIPAGQFPRVYMDAGRRDPYLSMASAFEDQLVRFGVPHEWYIFNGTHDEEYWSEHVAGYLEWYAQGWER